MFDRCIIHIGTEKTGTSSIQAVLKANAEPWSKMGVLIPSEFGSGNNRHFVNYAIDDGQYDDGRRRHGITDPATLALFRKDIEKRMEKLASAKKNQTLVISSEHCHSRLTREPSVDRLRRLLDPYCRSFTIICFLRPQHEVAVSLYSTAMRVGHADFPLIPQKDESDRYYNYDMLLDRWASVFGAENMRPVVYSPTDTLADFIRVSGLPTPVKAAPKENTSLNGRTQAFLKEINRVLPPQARGNIADLAANGDLSPSAMPARADAEQFFSAFRASNERVRQKWFPDRPRLFDPDFSRYPERALLPSISMEEAFEMFATVWERKQAQVDDLQRKLKSRRPVSS